MSQSDKNIPDELSWLNQINNIDNISLQFKKINLNYYMMIGLPQLKNVATLSNHRYSQLLHKYFEPYLKVLLIKNINDSDDYKRYSALKIFLMLTKNTHYNQKAIITWFSNIWMEQYPNNKQLIKQLQDHLNNLLNLHGEPWDIYNPIIISAQKQLQQLPIAKLALLELEDKYSSNKASILPKNKQLPGLDLSNITISSLYSADHFSKIYANTIPEIAKNIKEYCWVLGDSNKDPLNNEQLKQLITTIRSEFIKQHKAAWLATIPKIKLSVPKTFTELQESINLLTNKESSLNTLLNIIIGNATLSDDASVNNNDIKAMKSFIAHDKSTENIQATLDQLNQFIDAIISSPDKKLAAYNAAAQRFDTNGKDDAITHLLELVKTQPEPLKNWIQTIAKSSWNIILSNTHDYLNTMWTSSIIPEYKATIDHRFPLLPESKQDILLKDFTHFIGPGGTIDGYFNYYLKPFVNLDKNYWTWKTLEGKSIGLSQDTLNLFIRASLLQQMFFTENHDMPSTQFSLSPEVLSNQIDSFILDLDGQSIKFTANEKETSNFTWPGKDPGITRIRFINTNKQTYTLTTNGPWAWFRLLNQAKIETTDDPKVFYVTFILSNNTARFKLTAINRVNPFLPDIISQFRCPDTLQTNKKL